MYLWKNPPGQDGGAVGVANTVSLPQFKVLGYRQTETAFLLTTGNKSK